MRIGWGEEENKVGRSVESKVLTGKFSESDQTAKM